MRDDPEPARGKTTEDPKPGILPVPDYPISGDAPVLRWMSSYSGRADRNGDFPGWWQCTKPGETAETGILSLRTSLMHTNTYPAVIHILVFMNSPNP